MQTTIFGAMQQQYYEVFVASHTCTLGTWWGFYWSV